MCAVNLSITYVHGRADFRTMSTVSIVLRHFYEILLNREKVRGTVVDTIPLVYIINNNAYSNYEYHVGYET